MQESFAPEHDAELISNTLEKLLDRSGIADKCGGHLQSAWRNGAQGCLDIVWDPLNEVGSVLVLHVAHLILNLLHGDLTAAEFMLAANFLDIQGRTYKMAAQVR